MTRTQSITLRLAKAQELHARDRRSHQAFYTLLARDTGKTAISAIGLAVNLERYPEGSTMPDYAVYATRIAAHFGQLALGGK